MPEIEVLVLQLPATCSEQHPSPGEDLLCLIRGKEKPTRVLGSLGLTASKVGKVAGAVEREGLVL